MAAVAGRAQRVLRPRRVPGWHGGRGATRLYWNTQEDNARARLLYDKVARFNGFIRYDYPL
jgi:hypothetical protein